MALALASEVNAGGGIGFSQCAQLFHSALSFYAFLSANALHWLKPVPRASEFHWLKPVPRTRRELTEPPLAKASATCQTWSRVSSSRTTPTYQAPSRDSGLSCQSYR